MANEHNLVPQSKRTKSEQREIAKKGGQASGKARRKKSNFKKALAVVLSTDISDKNMAAALKSLGYEPTNEAAIALMTVQKALHGEMRAIELIERSSGQSVKDELDRKEQRERIKALQLENRKRELAIEHGLDPENVVQFVDDIGGGGDD